jgi:hypothetical protein
MWTSTGSSLSKLQSKTKNRRQFVALSFFNLKHDTHNSKMTEIVTFAVESNILSIRLQNRTFTAFLKYVQGK